MTERTNEPSTTVHETARHNNKSTCTDGEVAEMVARLREPNSTLQEYERCLMDAAAYLLTRLSAELEGCGSALRQEVEDRLTAEAERDALKAEKRGLMDSIDYGTEAYEGLRDLAVEVLEPIAQRCAEAVRPDDCDTSGLVVKIGHLRRASELHATLSGERK